MHIGTAAMNLTLPFDSYPGRGRQRLGEMCNGNCRTTYGKIFIQKTGQHDCAYCGMDLWNHRDRWKFMTLDHIVPQCAFKDKEIYVLPEFCHDYTNSVLSCTVCNGFENQFWHSYRERLIGRRFDTWEKCWDLRDEIFRLKNGLVAVKNRQDCDEYRSQNPSGIVWVREADKEVLTLPEATVRICAACGQPTDGAAR